MFRHSISPPCEGPVHFRSTSTCCKQALKKKGKYLQTKKHRIMQMIPLLAILVVAVMGYVFLRDVLSFQSLADNRQALETFRDENYLATVAVFMLAYIAIVVFSLPGATIATLTGGFLFSAFPGVFFNVVAATIGATGIFLAAKSGFCNRMAARMETSSGRWNSIKEELDHNQWSILIIVRLVPIIPFFVGNLLPAMVGVPLHRFVISTFIGIIPGGLVYTSVGSGLGAVLDRGEAPNLGIIFEPQVILPLLGLAALSSLPIVLRRYKKGL